MEQNAIIKHGLMQEVVIKMNILNDTGILLYFDMSGVTGSW